jgi:predicted transposase YbfD/YdcC
MDTTKYSTLLAALEAVPDPRQARGQRHPWRHLLLISAAGLASNHHSARALAQWAQFHAATLRAILPNLRRLPSESTILRALRSMDVQRLEHQLAQLVLAEPTTPDEADAAPAPARTCVQGQAVDGKWVRTATAHGARTLLLSVVHHHTGRTLAQAKVAAQHTEVTACQHLLHGRELRGTVTTMDAGLTHRGRAQHIRRQGGHYLMVVKQNHPVMRDEIALFFTAPRLPVDAHERYDCATSVTKGHGRLEVRTLECLPGQCADWQWPDVAQVLRRTCERVVCKTGKRTVTVSYGITSLTADAARAVEIERLWRGHWTLENRKHYVRDVTLGEDRHQMHTGHAPQVLAALRNALIDVWRAQGWHNMADAARACGASVQQALSCIGALPSRQ